MVYWQGLTQAATPTINPASESFNSSVQVTMTDSTSGATIYYTTDGSTPTTASTQYTAPFNITTTTTVNAIAAGNGPLASPGRHRGIYADDAGGHADVYPGTRPLYVRAIRYHQYHNGECHHLLHDGRLHADHFKLRNTRGPISVGATETLSAIAVASGLSNSPDCERTLHHRFRWSYLN